jgi:hypothetical protein
MGGRGIHLNACCSNTAAGIVFSVHTNIDGYSTTNAIKTLIARNSAVVADDKLYFP